MTYQEIKARLTKCEHTLTLLQNGTKNTPKEVDIEKIEIYGFCDDRGSDTYNLALSQLRADEIRIVFSNNEFDESVITNVDGKGEILVNLVREDDLSKIRGLNRKVEIIVTQVYPPKPKEVKVEKENTEAIVQSLKDTANKIMKLNPEIPKEAQIALENIDSHSFLTHFLAGNVNAEVAENVSILYGGSVKPANAKEIFSKKDVDGGLIGGAALKADSFISLVKSF